MLVGAKKFFKGISIGLVLSAMLFTSTAGAYAFDPSKLDSLYTKTPAEIAWDAAIGHIGNPHDALLKGLDPNETEDEVRARLARSAEQARLDAIAAGHESDEELMKRYGFDFSGVKQNNQTTPGVLAPLSERIFVYGKKVQFDVPPVIESGRTLVPIRMVAQELGAEVEWLVETSEAIITKDGKRIVLKVGSNKVTVDGVVSIIDVPAKVTDGRTLVPIRFISENMGYPIEFIEDSQEVHIG